MIFELRNITKYYGDTLANNDISIHLNRGEILCIVGENGAGKSTIMKILYGLEQPTSGEIWVNGKSVRLRNPSDAMEQGIGMVQQHFMLFESLSVAENIVFCREPRRGPLLDKKTMLAQVSELSERYKLKIDPSARISDCPVGLRQRVEILKILYQNAQIIIFDEPSAVLTPIEVEALLETMRELSAAGKSIVLITHKLNEVMAVADRIYVMRSGKLVAEREKAKTNTDELAYLMIGHHPEQRKISPVKKGATLLSTEDLTLHKDGRDVLNKVNLHVDGGEIVGIAGVSGNGQSELESVINGLELASSGKIFLCGEDITNASVHQRREKGMAHISEDRFLWGGAVAGTLGENALMAKEDKAEFNNNGFLRQNKIKDYARKLIERFSVKAAGTEAKLGELSGGNAQKLVAAREIMMEKPVLICCEPTRGIDVGASDFIHNEILNKREQGDAVLLISSELSEILALSDRIYVMFEGQIVGEFNRGMVDERELSLLMLGGKNRG